MEARTRRAGPKIDAKVGGIVCTLECGTAARVQQQFRAFRDAIAARTHKVSLDRRSASDVAISLHYAAAAAKKESSAIDVAARSKLEITPTSDFDLPDTAAGERTAIRWQSKQQV
jgi:hypothetical protein